MIHRQDGLEMWVSTYKEAQCGRHETLVGSIAKAAARITKSGPPNAWVTGNRDKLRAFGLSLGQGLLMGT